MTTEFDLSEKIWNRGKMFEEIIAIKDIKEFIRRLKEEIRKKIYPNCYKFSKNYKEQIKILNKLAGDKLKWNRSVIIRIAEIKQLFG